MYVKIQRKSIHWLKRYSTHKNVTAYIQDSDIENVVKVTCNDLYLKSGEYQSINTKNISFMGKVNVCELAFDRIYKSKSPKHSKT